MRRSLLSALGASSSAPPLPFSDYAYTGLDGVAWPLGRVTLSAVAAQHRLSTVPQATYAELNPDGARTLVFVHGLGSYLKFWRHQLDAAAAAGFRVVALDLLGFGKSDKPLDFSYTTEAQADVVREVIATLGVVKPVIVGHSMGGQTALSLAIHHPDVAEALVLVAPAGLEKFSASEALWFDAAVTPSFIKGADERALQTSIRDNNFHRWRPELEWIVEERVRVTGTADFDAYVHANVRAIRALARNESVRSALHRVQLPTLIVHGDRDRLIPNPILHPGTTAAVMAYGEQSIPGAERIELTGCGHAAQLDCPNEFNRVLFAYLERLG